MKTLNVYAVFNIEHPMVAWEVAIGRITTMTAVDRDGNEFPSPSLWMYNSILDGKKYNFYGDLQSEYQIEHIRHFQHPEKASRLNGAFFFESYRDAYNACKYWGWDSSLDYISKVIFTASHIGRYDSNWITNKIRSCQPTERREYIDKYFKGDAESSNPIWELVAQGHGVIMNTKLREMAYKKILDSQPNATYLLATAMSCFDSNPTKYSNILRIVPYFTNNKVKVKGQFIIDSNQFLREKKEINGIIKLYFKGNGKKFKIPKLDNSLRIQKIKGNHNKNDDSKSTFAVLDLRREDFEMDLKLIQNNIDYAINNNLIHN